MVAKPFYFSSTYAGFQQPNQLGHLDVVSQHHRVAGNWFVCGDLSQGLIWGPVVWDSIRGFVSRKTLPFMFWGSQNSQPPGLKPTN